MSRPLGAPAKTSRRQLAATAPGLLGRCAAGRAVKLDRHPVEPSDGRGQTAARTGFPGDSFAHHVSPGRHVTTGEAVPPTPGSSQTDPYPHTRPRNPASGAEMAGSGQEAAIRPQQATVPDGGLCDDFDPRDGLVDGLLAASVPVPVC